MGRLATDQGSLASQLKKLEDMGVKGKKPMRSAVVGKVHLEVLLRKRTPLEACAS